MKKFNLLLLVFSLLSLGSVLASVKPENLQIINLTDSSFTITWEIPAGQEGDVTNHTVFIKIGDDGASQIVRYVDKDTRSIDLIGTLIDGNGGDNPKEIAFTSATTYNVGIYAEPVDWDNSGECSAWIGATTLTAGEISEPAAPFNMVVSNITSNSFTLTWENDISSTATGISIADLDAGSAELWVAEVAAGVTTYTYTGVLTNWDGESTITVSPQTNYRVKLQAKPDTDYNAYSGSIDLQTAVATSLDDNAVTTKLSPNPTSGLFKVYNETAAFIEVYTIAGQSVLRQSIQSGVNVNMNSVEAGTYIVKVMSANHSILSVDKLIKL